MEEPRMNLKPGLVVSGVIIVLMLILSAWAWIKIPAGQLIPTHWGLNGQPDGYSSKAFGLLILPLAALAEAGLFLLIAKIEPRKRNIQLSAKAYTMIWVASLALSLVVHTFLVLAAVGQKMGINTVIPVALGGLFIIIGNYMGKIRSNFFAGIRTPWTLSSDLSWNKTHRLGGKLFILYGLITALGVLLKDMCLWVAILVSEGIVIIAILTVYSYLVWKTDPNRGSNSRNIGDKTSEPKWMVPASILLMIVLAGGLIYSAQRRTPVDIVNRAQEVAQSMAGGDFAGAEKYFDDRMKQALPPEKLQSVWQSLGQFEQIRGTRVERCWPFQIVYVMCEFHGSEMDLKVVFNRKGEVSGLWIAPAQNGEK